MHGVLFLKQKKSALFDQYMKEKLIKLILSLAKIGKYIINSHKTAIIKLRC
jgi:hypothetical protein